MLDTQTSNVQLELHAKVEDEGNKSLIPSEIPEKSEPCGIVNILREWWFEFVLALSLVIGYFIVSTGFFYYVAGFLIVFSYVTYYRIAKDLGCHSCKLYGKESNCGCNSGCCGAIYLTMIIVILMVSYITLCFPSPAVAKLFMDGVKPNWLIVVLAWLLILILYIWVSIMLFDIFVGLFCFALTHLCDYKTPSYYFKAKIIFGVVVGLIINIIAFHQGSKLPLITHHDIYLQNLPASMNGFTIVAIADLHMGPQIGSNNLQEVVNEIKNLDEIPDLIAFVGDNTDTEYEFIYKSFFPLSELQAVCGMVFVQGNHDAGHDSTRNKTEVMEKWGDYYQKNFQIRSLNNERIFISQNRTRCEINSATSVASGEGFYLLGVEDPRVGKPDLQKTLRDADPDVATVLLAHQPNFYEEVNKIGGVDFMISGHTHGGNTWPLTWIVALANKYYSGFYREGDLQIYVSEGVNMWGMQARFLTTRELPIFRLKAALN